MGNDDRDIVCMEAFPVGSSGFWLNDNPLKASFPLLMIQMGIIILSCNCIHRFIGRRLHQPTIVSQIIVGILLGPSCLGRFEYIRSLLYPPQNWVSFSTVGNTGLMFIMFILGLRTDVSLVKGIRKRDAAVAVIGQTTSILMITIFSFLTHQNVFGKSLGLTSTIDRKFAYMVPSVAIRWSVSSYIVILFLLEELNLLNSKLGRLSNSITLFGTLFHVVWSNLFVSVMQSKLATSPTTGFAVIAGFVFLLVFILFVARPIVLWMISRTRDRNRTVVDPAYIDVVLVLTLASGFFSEITGHSADVGTFLLGLVLPSGAPLGSTFVERLGTMIHGFGAPVFVAGVIFNADISGLWSIVRTLGSNGPPTVVLFLLVLAILGKFLGVFLPLFFLCKHPIKDALAVSLILSAVGLYEIKIVQLWKTYGTINEVTSGMIIVVILVFAAVTTPLIKALYKPSTAYRTNRRRTIQHTKHDSELKLLACIHNQDNVPSVINLLEDFEINATAGTVVVGSGRNCDLPNSEGSTTVFVLHLIELVGKAASFMAPYRENTSSSSSSSETGHIVNAFKYLERSNPCSISIQPFVSNSPYATVHQDICTLALEKKVVMVILPFHKKMTLDGRHMESTNQAFRTLNTKVLALAPCSVGILVNHGINESATATVSLVLNHHHHPHHQHLLLHNIAVYFIGGADDREALAFALRVLRNTEIAVTLVRFLPPLQWRHQDRDELLDEEIIKEFQMNSMRRSMRKRAIYREEVVEDGAAMVAIIRHISQDFNLLIVGRGEGRVTKLMAGLSAWSEFPELGIVGDMLASPEFGSTTEILVVQQQRFGTIQQRQGHHQNSNHQKQQSSQKYTCGLEKASSCGSRVAQD